MKKKRSARRLLLRLLVLIICTCGFLLCLTLASYRQGERIYDHSRQSLTLLAREPGAEAGHSWQLPLIEVDFATLQAANPEVCGWLLIPGTKISYPLTQGEDNSLYLDHTYDLQKNKAGCIFVDARNNPGFDDFNTVIYGHNMKNGSMFGDLNEYRHLDYWLANPYLYIITPAGMRQYQIFSAYVGAEDDDAYVVDFSNVERQEFIRRICNASLIQGVTRPAEDDLIVTLSTCTSVYSWQRFLVHARLVATDAADADAVATDPIQP